MAFAWTERNRITVGSLGASGATSDVTGTSVDMAAQGGFSEVTFIAVFGTAASNNTIKVQQSDDNGSSDDWTDLTGSSVSVGASDEVVVASVSRPAKRYLRAVALRGTSSTLQSLTNIQSDPNVLPVTSAVAGTLASELSVTPSEGTA